MLSLDLILAAVLYIVYKSNSCDNNTLILVHHSVTHSTGDLVGRCTVEALMVEVVA